MVFLLQAGRVSHASSEFFCHFFWYLKYFLTVFHLHVPPAIIMTSFQTCDESIGLEATDTNNLPIISRQLLPLHPPPTYHHTPSCYCHESHYGKTRKNKYSVFGKPELIRGGTLEEGGPVQRLQFNITNAPECPYGSIEDSQFKPALSLRAV